MLGWTAKSQMSVLLTPHPRLSPGGQLGGELKDAGLDIRFHDLRHTCITKLVESQTSEQTIMAIAGHLSRAMVEHYSHIRMAAKRAAVEGITKSAGPANVQAAVNQNVHQPANVHSGAPAN